MHLYFRMHLDVSIIKTLINLNQNLIEKIKLIINNLLSPNNKYKLYLI